MILEDTYFEVKNAIAFGGPSGLQTLGLQTNVSAKPVLKNKFVKMLRIFYIEIDIF